MVFLILENILGSRYRNYGNWMIIINKLIIAFFEYWIDKCRFPLKGKTPYFREVLNENIINWFVERGQ